MAIRNFEAYHLEDFVKNRLTKENIEYVKFVSPNNFMIIFQIKDWGNEIVLSKRHFEIWSGVKVVNSIHYGSMEEIFNAMSMIVFFVNK